MRDENGSATHPVQGPGTSDVATQPLQAPGAGTATQPPQAPGAGSEVLPTGIESTQLNKPLSGVRPEFAGESDIHIAYLLIFGCGGGGPVWQPPLALNEKALCQPKSHPSNRIV